MSISLRLARRSAVGAGLRGPSPRVLSSLSAPRRPGLSSPSSVITLSSTGFLTQRRAFSDSGNGVASAASDIAASTASAAPHATASAADVASAIGTPGLIETVWQGAKTVLSFPSNVVAETLINLPTPSYVLSVFVLAYALRATLTFPLQVWQRKRIERLQRYVHPQLEGINDRIALETMVTAKKEGWPYAKYVEEVRKRVSVASLQTGELLAEVTDTQMADAVFTLHKTHKTHPWVTMLAPAAVNIPLLIAASWGVRNALIASPEIANSSSLWLQSLGEPDPTAILPIASAILAYANIEIIQRAQRIRKELHKLLAVEPPKPLEPIPNDPAALKPIPGPSPEAANKLLTKLSQEDTAHSDSLNGPGLRKTRASTRLERPRSQIVDETKVKPGSDPKIHLENLKERRRRRGKPQLENVSKVNRALAFALSDRERMSKGFGNFMALVSIGIVPMGMMTPSVSLPPTSALLPLTP